MRYFTSDTHFFHADLLGMNDFAPRPFENIAQLHKTIISNWNAVVGPNDIVYHLGDIAVHPKHEAGFLEILAILEELSGQIIFVKGNHDSRAFLNYLIKADPKKFSYHDVGLIKKFHHHQFFLTHYPMLMGKSINSINLHGHIHHAMLPIAENINVGIDAPENDFLNPRPKFGAPISENQLIEIYEAKKAEIARISGSQ
ncbi:metallophosphoesterase [Enterococcus timonensis]|uniref:metallophosphoesterase n=1 Tax=Enterococcus timonensis TaxID=1852364 RepID=UPI0008DAEE43|nr:metallophosphoesterase [Enterococcus timonensis]